MLLDYVHERFPLRLYAPLALLLATGAMAGRGVSAGGEGSGGVMGDVLEVARAAAIALALMFPLRLWDDLEDLPSDRAAHPTRVLSRAQRIAPFRALLAASLSLGAALLSVLDSFLFRLALFGALVVALFIWYRARRRLFRGALVGSFVILAKYPVILYLVGDLPVGRGVAWPRALAAALVYASFCVYEILHDPRVRGERYALSLLGAEMLFMAAVSSLMGVAIAQRSAAAASLHAALGLASACALLMLLLRCQRGGALPSSAKGVFVLCFLQIMSFTVGIRR
jgi:hypothetical protein